MSHAPVMLEEAVGWLDVRPAGVYVDCTLGAGGYAEAIAGKLTAGRLIAIDRDAEMIRRARERLARFGSRIEFVQASFGDLERVLGGERVDGIVADLGLSRDQIEDPQRGFSFQSSGPLDMRFDRSRPLTAGYIINTYGEKAISDLVFRYGEERRARRIARAIVRARPISDTKQLAEVIGRAAPRTARERIHPATRTFQALRIVVNDELGELEKLLESAPPLLKRGGRFVVVSFHSLEDRAVKLAFRRWAGRKTLRILTKHVIRPGEEELGANPASRSAKLRAAERIEDGERDNRMGE